MAIPSLRTFDGWSEARAGCEVVRLHGLALVSGVDRFCRAIAPRAAVVRVQSCGNTNSAPRGDPGFAGRGRSCPTLPRARPGFQGKSFRSYCAILPIRCSPELLWKHLLPLDS